MSEIVVFLGPSCDRQSAAEVLDADYRPTAAAGDIRSAVEEGASTIVLIDGLMIYGYPPPPMEVHAAARAGVEVYGAASLGALRAVELRHHGVRGTGWVYEQYLTGRVIADDELLSMMHPATQRPFTLPLIRIRFAVERLVEEGRLDSSYGAELLSRLRTTYFEQRTPSRIRELAADSGFPAAAVDELFREEYDIKAIDTRRCLALVLEQAAHR